MGSYEWNIHISHCWIWKDSCKYPLVQWYICPSLETMIWKKRNTTIVCDQETNLDIFFGILSVFLLLLGLQLQASFFFLGNYSLTHLHQLNFFFVTLRWVGLSHLRFFIFPLLLMKVMFLTKINKFTISIWILKSCSGHFCQGKQTWDNMKL